MNAHPQTVFTELGTQVIDHGLADPLLTDFYESIRSAKVGQATEQLKRFMPYLSLCSDTMSCGAPPPIFYVGKESGQRRIFGDDWAAAPGPAAALRTPDMDLERASAEGYRKALDAGSYYGYARTDIQVSGREYEVAYERLILTIRPTLRSNYRFCAYFGVIQDLQRKI